MSLDTVKASGTELFHTYLSDYKDQARKEKSADFYHVDVVADAYNQGFCNGQESGRKEFIEDLKRDRTEKFTQKATQVYILTNRAIDHIQKNGFSVDSFFINIAHDNPKAIIAVKDEQLLDDEFIMIAYSKIFELKRIFAELFECTFDIGLISSSDLDVETLKGDRYDYSETIG